MQSLTAASDLAILDLAGLRDRTNDDDELVREVMRDFLADSVEMLGKISISVARGRFDEAAKESHRIRGALLSLGALCAASSAGDLELACSPLSTVADADRAAHVSTSFERLQEDVELATTRMADYLSK